jgi:vanillate O-demethylase ferredoxin subunit
VEVPQLGMTLSVPSDVSMLEALEEAGADMMFDCRKGECGLCEAKVLEVTGAIDHRDVFLSEGQHEEGDRILTCVSRVVSPRTIEPTAADGPGAISIAIP